MKRKLGNFYKAVRRELRENKSTFWVYTGLRLLVIIMMVLQLFNRNYENVFLCLLTLLLMIMPSVVQATFKVEFPHWDTVLHTLNGFLCAAIGFSLVDIMNRQSRLKFDLSPLFMAITAFCFSMTIGVLWEFFEFGMDCLFNLDMQKDTVIYSISSTFLDPTKSNHPVKLPNITDVAVNGESLGLGGYLDIGLMDTMYDLVVNFVGAFVFSVMGYVYVKRREAKGLVEGLVPEPWSEEKRSAGTGRNT